MHSSLIGNVKHPHHVYPPLALKYVEALIHKKGGYETKLIDTWFPMQEDGRYLPFYLHNPKVFRQLSRVTGIL
jgi:hypothetical protein